MGAPAILTGIFISDAGSSGRDWGAALRAVVFFAAEHPARRTSTSGGSRFFQENIFAGKQDIVFIRKRI
jgi:hypothetical protein